MVDPARADNQARMSSATDDAYSQRIGSTIKGKWRLDALLGVGGMAAVYAATHRNGQRAAIKILHTDFARDKGIYERFLREAYVSNQINHPVCVPVLDDDVTEDGEPYLVMLLLEGGTLREVWHRGGGKLPVVQVLELMDPVLDCLAACHAIGVIHRDLKPANIFVTKAGEVKLLDFGVAQMRSATAERTAMGTALGTPHYMSPEQAMGLVDQLDGRADLFSVGAMLHALITGERINKGRTEGEALVMAATKPVPSVARLAPDLPLEVISLIDKALAWDPRNRFSDAREMQAAVRAALGRIAPERARPETPPPQGRVVAPADEPAAPVPAASVLHSEISAELEVAEDDPSIVQMRDLFGHIERLLPNTRQMGWEHPATERAFRTTFEALIRAQEHNRGPVEFSVGPYSFTHLGQMVWEPEAPHDGIPYNLFAAGLRAVRFAPGVTMDELRELLSVIVLEPGRDLPPEDDIASVLWERDLGHIEVDAIDAFAEGDAAEREAFFDESDELERMAADAARAKASSVEAKAMSVSTDEAALRSTTSASSVMAFDETVHLVLGGQLAIERRRWNERYVDAVVEGILDAARCGDLDHVLYSLRRSAMDLAVLGRLDGAVSFHHAVLARLRARQPTDDDLAMQLTDAMFRGETLAIALRSLQAEPEKVPFFEPIFANLAASELETVLSAIRSGADGVLLLVLVSFIERWVVGHEADVAQAASGLPPDTAAALLGVLARAGTQQAIEALGALCVSEDPAVRVEAKLLTEPPEQAQAELGALLEDVSAPIRMAAVRAILRHAVKGAWPAIARRIKQSSFHDLDVEEARELLRAVFELSPERGEQLVLEIVTSKGGLLASERREATRIAAAELLGASSRSPATATALRAVSQSRWGASAEARAAASRAADEIQARPKVGPQDGGG